MNLTSSSFSEGSQIPQKYTYTTPGVCDGQNISPALAWTGAPAGTQSFALVMLDPDASDWVHWLQFDIAPGTDELQEAVGGPNAGVKGRNGWGQTGYGGPCPPRGTHRYTITLYALDALLKLPEGASLADFEDAASGHVIGQARLGATRTR